MALTPAQRSARATLAAHRRHHGDDDAKLPPEAAALEQEANDRWLDELVARAPKMTPEQIARLRPMVQPLYRSGREIIELRERVERLEKLMR